MPCNRDPNTKQNVFMLHLIFIAVIATSSCAFGLFNLNYPEKSEFCIYIDNEKQDNLSENMSLTFSLDDEKYKNKFLKIEGRHTKNKNTTAGHFSYSSDNARFSVVNDSAVLIALNDIKSLGSHIINAESSIDREFDKKFIINTISAINRITVDYSLDNKVTDFDYGGADNGSISSDEVLPASVKLIAGSTYTFTASNDENLCLPELFFHTDTDDSLACFETINDRCAKLTISQEAKDDEFYITAGIKNSDIAVKFQARAIDIAKAVITERDKAAADTRFIYMEKRDGRHQYDIDIHASSDSNRSLLAYFAKQENDNDISESVGQGLRKRNLQYIDSYIDLYFDGDRRSIAVNPLNDTVEGNENLHMYLYLWDSMQNYLGRWRFFVGGKIEKIQIDERRLEYGIAQSGSVSATLFPDNGNTELIWYLSQEKGNDFHIPVPMDKAQSESIISFPEMLSGRQVAVNGTDYSSLDHCFASSNGRDHCIYFTTGSTAISCYLVAKYENIWDSVPVLVSGDGRIIIKSERNVNNKSVPTINWSDDSSFISAMETKNLPYGQSFPDTAEHNRYGVTTRTFYLPHDAESEITLSTAGIKTLAVIQNSDANKIFSSILADGSSESSKVLTISPKWYEMKQNSIVYASSPAPAASPYTGIDSYGRRFYEYLGIGLVKVNADESTINLRIVIYGNC